MTFSISVPSCILNRLLLSVEDEAFTQFAVLNKEVSPAKCLTSELSHCHCVKNVRIRSYSGPYFPVFGLNTERYGVSLRIQSKCGKMRTRITRNTDTFHAACGKLLI